MALKAKFPIELAENVIGQIAIDIRIPKNMQVLLMSQGIGPEEQANLCGQKLQEVLSILGLNDE